MVYAPSSELKYSFNIRSHTTKPRRKRYISVVICTGNRPDSLKVTLDSLERQNFRNFEVILITEKGHLSQLRQAGLNASQGQFTIFIDDDVEVPPYWVRGMKTLLERKGVVGVTGPTIVRSEYLKNRDVFKYPLISKIHNRLFLDGISRHYPGFLSSCGAPSFASNFTSSCKYEGEVDYLECCNMGVHTDTARKVGGFSNEYTLTSEWSEVDLSLCLGKVGKLWYSTACGLYHNPSKQGVYRDRIKTKHRWKNFMTFQRKYIDNTPRTKLYRSFVWTYLNLKSILG